MNFEQHLFISYAILDNRPLQRGELGWISRFHEALDALLSMRLGRFAKIWRDDNNLDHNAVLSAEILGRLKQSATLVSILTPRYFESAWCTQELHGFCEYAEQTVGLTVENKSRVFKILKMPLDPQEHDRLPPLMRDTLGYEFFVDEGKGPLELDSAYGPRFAQLHNTQVAMLALDIAKTLKKLEADANSKSSEAPATPDKPAVFLAECSFDQKPERMLLEGELKRLGYCVLPDKPLPQDREGYVATVKEMLSRCALSVHLIGCLYGNVPGGTNPPSGGVAADGGSSPKSGCMIQNELAVERYAAGNFTRLIWLPEGTTSPEPQQQAFIDALQRDAHAQYGADLIAGDIERFRGAIHDTLKKIEEPKAAPAEGAPASPADEGDGKQIYVLCVEQDRKATVPLRKLCQQFGLRPVLPNFEGDAADIRQNNQKLLASCDAVLLYYGAGGEAWKRAVDNDLRKLGAYRAGKPLPPILTYLGEPKTDSKADLIDMEEPGLINGLEGTAAAVIAERMQSLVTEQKAVA